MCGWKAINVFKAISLAYLWNQLWTFGCTPKCIGVQCQLCNISPLKVKLACMNLYRIQHTLFDCQQRQKTFLSPMSSTSKLVTILSSSILTFLLIRGLFCLLRNRPKRQEKDKSIRQQNFHPFLKLEPITECIYSTSKGTSALQIMTMDMIIIIIFILWNYNCVNI